MNLSQAVTVCLYEFSQLNMPLSEQTELASHDELERLFTHLREGFEGIHYVYGSKADQLMHGVRHLISRAQPTPQEVRMLHGLARQMLFVANAKGIDKKE
jgi:tRNA/rRNA methyltransferase